MKGLNKIKVANKNQDFKKHGFLDTSHLYFSNLLADNANYRRRAKTQITSDSVISDKYSDLKAEEII